jgi:chemotaxis protein MotA
MFVIIGFVVVFGSFIGGFMIAGGNPVLLIQISEFITILGVAFGSLLIMTPFPNVIKIIKSVLKLFSAKHSSKEGNMKLLKALYELFLVAQREGLLAIEKHIEDPASSEVFKHDEHLLKNPIALTFLTDTLKVMLSGGVPPHEIEALMDTEIETFEAETKPLGHTLQTFGDSFPGIGIVAAVLGIIITMSSINEGAEVVGHHVAAALVGTFLGVLIAYGFVGPLAANMSHMYEDEARYLGTIKAAVVAYAKGNPPIVAVEIARRTLYSDARPTFSELESYLRGK